MRLNGSEFCDDLKAVIDVRTKNVLANKSLGFAQKVTELAHISSTRLTYAPGYQEESLKSQAKAGKFVAALVHSPYVPMMEAVFLGQVNQDRPLSLYTGGVATLSVESGVLARVYTNNDGHRRRFGISGRADDQLTDVGTDELELVPNRLIPATFQPSPMTPLADRVIAKIDGLDFKIVHEGINAPEVDENGNINEERYDRLGLLKHFGREAYVSAVMRAREVSANGARNEDDLRLRITQYNG